MQLRRFWKPALAVSMLAGAYALTQRPGGLGVDIDGSSQARAAGDHDPYDLTRLAVLNRALYEVTNHYVEPQRIDYEQMLKGGLNAIQRSVAPVIVRFDEGSPNLEVQVGEARQSFPASAQSPWDLSERFKAVFAFLQRNLDHEEIDLRDIEYAAVNGMLRTLDPHTVLLTPDVFEEMQMSTRGEFGGLGIVISIRDGHLTVIKPMPGTPADRAGLRRRDRVVKINDESTTNMALTEAVDRLRGAPGSSVRIWISREGANGTWGAPQRIELQRAVIHIESVEHRSLGDGIGYIKILSFQGNTHDDLVAALRDLHRSELRGLVLDLRDNPGGLLDQAIRISDTFLTEGNIVTTALADPTQREERAAEAEGTEPNYPMVVLINGSSASASEIVAGALKNHNRALIIGQRSFGKGSVQQLENFSDGSALKLTIAQYLTPGDESIQGVGITPDIGIDPMTVDPESMDLSIDPEGHLREADLRAHLTSDHTRAQAVPGVMIRYYLDGAARRALLEADPQDQENAEENEFLTRFSKQVLQAVSHPTRPEMLREAAAVVASTAEAEMRTAVAELQRVGVDWSEGTDAGASTVNVEVTTDRENHTAQAGSPFNLRVRVTNTGTAPLYRLTGSTKSDFPLFNDRELIFGRIAPGETKEWTTTLGICETEERQRVCRLPRELGSRADGVRIHFEELHGHAPADAELRTVVQALPQPSFAYSVQVVDDLQGNGDGALSRGERASLYLRVKNVGDGPSFETHATLRNLSGRGILLQDGRFRLDNMARGEERSVRFTFEVLTDFEASEAKLEVSVVDADLRDGVSEKLELPIVAGETPTPVTNGRRVVRDAAELRSGASAASPLLGRVAGALPVTAEATLNGFTRVRVPTARDATPVVAWVPSAALDGSGTGGSIHFEYPRMQPRIQVQVSDAALVTRGANFQLRGQASDAEGIRDMYVFVGAQKVHFQNGGGPGRTTMDFDTSVPLHRGINYITIFARQSDEVVSRRVVVVRRDGAQGELLETPRWDEEDLFFEDGAGLE